MKIAVIGGPGTVGTGIVNLLKENHEIISISRTAGDYQVDLRDPNQIERMFRELPGLDGLISAIGDGKMAPINELEVTDFTSAMDGKLSANHNLVKAAGKHLSNNGFVILTSGIASNTPISGAATLAAACAATDAYTRTAALEYKGHLRVNAVSPAYVKETLEAFGMDSSEGISALDTARVYASLVNSNVTGIIADVPQYLQSIHQHP